jgi:hypothetical protein
MTEVTTTCSACGETLTMETLHSDGAAYSCPCGRTRLTFISEGKLELGLDKRVEHGDPGDEHRPAR